MDFKVCNQITRISRAWHGSAHISSQHTRGRQVSEFKDSLIHGVNSRSASIALCYFVSSGKDSFHVGKTESQIRISVGQVFLFVCFLIIQAPAWLEGGGFCVWREGKGKQQCSQQENESLMLIDLVERSQNWADQRRNWLQCKAANETANHPVPLQDTLEFHIHRSETAQDSCQIGCRHG